MISKAIFSVCICFLVASDVIADDAAIAQVQAKGGRVIKLAQDDDRLEISYHLSDQEIKDVNLAPLAKLTKVYQVNLRGTKITDAGLKYLAGLKSLVHLHLEKTAITDAGLKHLVGLQNLTYLNLYGTKVTDAGLEQLAGLKSLKKLYLWQTGTTEAGIKKLQAKLPKAQIISGLTLIKPAPPKKEEEKKPEK